MWVSRTHKPTFLHGQVWLLWRFYIRIYSTKKYSLSGWCYKYMNIYLIVYARHEQQPLKPLHNMTLDTTIWSPRHDLYVPIASFIYIIIIIIIINHLQGGEDFSWWIQVGFLKLVEKHSKIKRAIWKSLSQVFQLLSPLYKKNVYRDDKLEDNWKCKVRRKMDWKMIQSVKQEGNEVEFGKKWEKNIFF